MIPGSREKRGVGPSTRLGPSVADVTLVAAPPARRREGRAGGQLYLERDSLIEMTERPLLVMSRPLSGEQTQIVRRPVRKASGRRWIFIFGGAATAALLAACLGLGHHARTSEPVALMPPPLSAPMPSLRENAEAARPIVAPLAMNPTFASTTSFLATPPVAPSRRTPRSVSATVASGRHTKSAPARIASTSRLAAHRAPARAARSAATVAWVDPFIDR